MGVNVLFCGERQELTIYNTPSVFRYHARYLLRLFMSAIPYSFPAHSHATTAIHSQNICLMWIVQLPRLQAATFLPMLLSFLQSGKQSVKQLRKRHVYMYFICYHKRRLHFKQTYLKVNNNSCNRPYLKTIQAQTCDKQTHFAW